MPLRNFEKKYDYEVAKSVFADPLRLYDQDPDYREPPAWAYRGIGAGAVTGLFCNLLFLVMTRRPLYSGIHLTAWWGAAGAGVGHIIIKTLDKYTVFRDQVYRHYIETHPEDFPLPS